MNQSPFYLVWNPNGWPPKYEHRNYESAEREATRLARENPNQKFYVLAPLSEVVRNDVLITKYEPDSEDSDVPF